MTGRATAALLLTVGFLGVVMIASASRDRSSEPTAQIQVIDQGFSYFGSAGLTYAFIVKNSSDDVGLKSGQYRVRFLDSSDKVLLERSGDLPAVLPDQEVAVAEEALPVSAKPDRMEVSIEKPRYERVGAIPVLEKARATYLTGPAGDGGSVRVGTGLWNPYGQDIVGVRLTAVFLDPSGRIRGGGSTTLPIIGAGPQYAEVSLVAAPRVTSGSVVLYPAIETAQLAEVRAAAEKLARVPTPVPEVAWVPTNISLYTGPETDRMDLWGAGEPHDWQVWVLEGDGEPRMLKSTPRWTYEVRWSPDGSHILARVNSAISPSGPFLNGWVALDPATRAIAWQAISVAGYLDLSLTGDRLLLQKDRYSPDRQTDVFSPDGSGRRLDGLYQDVMFVDWAPDGRGFLGFAVDKVIAGRPQGSLVLVPLDDGLAQRVPGPLIKEPEVHAAWSPDGSQLAFLAQGDLYLFDRSTGQTRQVTTGTQATPGRPVWSPDGRKVAIQRLLVDLSSGKVVDAAPGLAVIGSAISPDGRYFAVAEEPFYSQPEDKRCLAAGLRNRIHLYDSDLDVSNILLDCDRGFHVIASWDPVPRWLADSRHLLLRTTNCWACGGTTIRVSLVDAVTGELRVLVDKESQLQSLVSPDGRRVAITGAALRVFDLGGNLLRQIDPPEGYAVRGAAWSPDGSKLAYILAPAWFVPPG